LEINLNFIQNNIQAIESLTQRPMMAVVKANAYGHGLKGIAKAAYQTGICWFGVARLEEALDLVKAGIDRNILVLGYTSPEAAKFALNHPIHLSVFNQDMAQAYSNIAHEAKKQVKIHVKIDSGMGRLGIFPEEGVDFIKWLTTLPHLDIEGVFTHFARADEPVQNSTDLQIQKFDALIQSLSALALRPPVVHAANSGATLCFPLAKYDLIRPGILMYGLSPSDEVNLPAEIKPAMQWKTRLTSIKILPPHHGVSYGHQYVTQKEERVGAIAAGYADGFRRVMNNVVLINGKYAPVLGRVCMDQAMISLETVPNAKIGDEVVLLGKQGELRISAEMIAKRWNTINYEVIAALADRIQRVYLFN